MGSVSGPWDRGFGRVAHRAQIIDNPIFGLQGRQRFVICAEDVLAIFASEMIMETGYARGPGSDNARNAGTPSPNAIKTE